MKAGVVLNPATPLESIQHVLHQVDLILLMSGELLQLLLPLVTAVPVAVPVTIVFAWCSCVCTWCKYSAFHGDCHFVRHCSGCTHAPAAGLVTVLNAVCV